MDKFIALMKDVLVTDQFTGKPSHTKFWSNIALATCCGVFAWSVMTGHADNTLWMIFLSGVAGNATFNKILNFKYGKPAEDKTAETK